MKDKRGLEIAITTVIMIVLSISVLTVLVIFFNSQTGFLNRFLGTQTSESNVDAFISGCESFVASQSFYTYCCEKREVRFGEGEGGGKFTCDAARVLDWSSERIFELDCSATNCVDSEGNG